MMLPSSSSWMLLLLLLLLLLSSLLLFSWNGSSALPFSPRAPTTLLFFHLFSLRFFLSPTPRLPFPNRFHHRPSLPPQTATAMDALRTTTAARRTTPTNAGTAATPAREDPRWSRGRCATKAEGMAAGRAARTERGEDEDVSTGREADGTVRRWTSRPERLERNARKGRRGRFDDERKSFPPLASSRSGSPLDGKWLSSSWRSSSSSSWP
mmetsp:Transcript_816/g.1813  ORF Transcript_816/g.1813 Transcript_816/m.1813 type:complete len:210 (+) Transcript_816:421-1050(+)